VVVKVGSSSLTLPDGTLNETQVRDVAGAVSAARERGQRVVLVSSGAVAAGVGHLGIDRRPTDLVGLQAAAMVGQSWLMAAYSAAFAERGIGIGQVLLTADDVVRRRHYANAQASLTRLLDLGIVPIVNENDAVANDELRLGDNDRLAALVAHLVSASVLVLLTDVDGLYTAPPTESGSRLIKHVAGPADLAGLDITGRGSRFGTGGMASKVHAATMATSFGVPVILTSTATVALALEGADVGTWFAATGKRTHARTLWLAYAAQARGSVTVDDGAAAVLRRGGASLLPVGITESAGNFDAGDVIEVRTATGELLGRGLSAYNASELARLQGVSGAGRPAIHVDDLALLPRG